MPRPNPEVGKETPLTQEGPSVRDRQRICWQRRRERRRAHKARGPSVRDRQRNCWQRRRERRRAHFGERGVPLARRYRRVDEVRPARMAVAAEGLWGILGAETVCIEGRADPLVPVPSAGIGPRGDLPRDRIAGDAIAVVELLHARRTDRPGAACRVVRGDRGVRADTVSRVGAGAAGAVGGRLAGPLLVGAGRKPRGDIGVAAGRRELVGDLGDDLRPVLRGIVGAGEEEKGSAAKRRRGWRRGMGGGTRRFAGALRHKTVGPPRESVV